MGVLRAGALPGLHMQPTAQVINGSLKFKGGQYLQRTSTAGNQKTWTWSGWIKVSDLTGNNIFGEDGGYPNVFASFNTSGQLRFSAAAADESVFLNLITTAQFRDFNAWYHFVIVYDSGNATSSERAKIYVNGKRLRELSTATYPSQNATTVVNSNGNAFRIGSHSGVDHLQGYMSQCYFIDGLALGPGYFGFTDPLTNTWRPKKFRAVGTTINDGTVWSNSASVSSGGSDMTNAFDGSISSYTSVGLPDGGATVTFTPPSAITVSSGLRVYMEIDRGQSISVNGLQTNASVSAGWNDTGFTGSLTSLVIGPANSGSSNNISAIEVDGIILKDSTTTNLDFSTNGFYLPMDDEDRFRLDQSEKNNHFTESGWSGTSIDPDVVKDSPSGAVFGGRAQTGITTTSSAPSNYATFNPLDKNSGATLSDGNLKIQTTTNVWKNTPTSIGMKTGKFYCEFGPNLWSDSNNHCQPGVRAMVLGNTFEMGATNYTAFYHYTGTKFFNGPGGAGTAFGDAWNDNSTNVIGIAFDADTRKVWFSKNGVWQGSGDPANGNNEAGTINLYEDGTYAFCLGTHGNSGLPNGGAEANFGQKPFKYAPPQGFLPVNSASARPNTVITRPDQYVGIITATGTAGDRHFKTPGGFGPDLVWAKERNAATNNALFDTLRGATKRIVSNSDQVEDTQATQLKSFTYDGFIYGSDLPNNTGDTGVYWCWRAGGAPTATNDNTSGAMDANSVSIDGVLQSAYTPSGSPSVYPKKMSIGTKQGFSIVTWSRSSGTDTISHGLSQAPTFIIQKSTSAQKRWQVGWEVEGWDRRLYLNLTDADSDSTSFGWSGNYGPTNTLIRTGGTSYVDGDMIAFCWHDVPGLQKFGKFSGNGLSDGVFVELGFRPAILLIKNDNSTGDWIIWDNARDPVNPVNKQIWPYTTSGTYGAYDQVGSNYPLDFLSNGFKMRTTDADMNSSSRTYLYAAWAEQPVSNLFGGQSTGR